MTKPEFKSSLLDIGDGMVAGAASVQGNRTVSDGATGRTLTVLGGNLSDKDIAKHPSVERIREERAADPAADRDAERLERLRNKAGSDSADPDEPVTDGEDGEALTATEAEE